MNRLSAIIIGCCFLLIACEKDSGFLTISESRALPVATPVSIKLPQSLQDQHKSVLLKNNDRLQPVQFDGDSAWLILDKGSYSADLPPMMVSKSADAQQERTQIEKNDSTIIFKLNQKPVLSFVHTLTNVPQRTDSLFVRDGFIHPLWSPNGSVLTEIHPTDHLHHLGLWHPWTRVKFREQSIDFWNLGSGSGTVRMKNIVRQQSGPVFSFFEAEKEYFQIAESGQFLPVIDEQVQVRLWDVPDLSGYLFDYQIDQKCATIDSVEIEQYRYGGFGLRATAQWTGENRYYLSSEGHDINSADGSRARWCIVGGQTQNGPSSILFMSHPANREHPEPLRIWGNSFDGTFFNFCPIKQKSWTLQPGKTYTRRYRLYISDEILTSEQAENLWQVYSNPPRFDYLGN